ncbi:hypothetical protein WJX73_001714 [Symbiochloris irregularis]|uniref:Uncharacterized protein n=1 Tax=Symbiochloris irregularis TaxID=706552 RepID=A0AAW1P7E2_9CHLO
MDVFGLLESGWFGPGASAPFSGSSPHDSAHSGQGREDEEAVKQAAWRWRFNRRWAHEQARHLDPDRQTLDDEMDAWDEALGFLDACGPVSRGYIGRTVSTEQNLGQSLRSQGSGLSTANMLEESQHDSSLLKDQAELDATRALSSIARRAQDLFKQQQQIEKQVEQRWSSTGGKQWVGAQMPSATVERFGQCPFVLVRVAEREPGPKCLLVRSAHDASEPRLLAAVTAEAQTVRSQHNLAPVQIALVGAGTLQWSTGRSDGVSIVPGTTADAAHSPGDVARLAASVLRTSLPMHERISVAPVAAARSSIP